MEHSPRKADVLELALEDHEVNEENSALLLRRLPPGRAASGVQRRSLSSRGRAGASAPLFLSTRQRRTAAYIADTTDGTDQSVQAAILASGYLVEEAPSTSAITA